MERLPRLSHSLAVVCALALLPASRAAEWVVNCAGTGTHASIQAAIDAAADGDTILVEPCTVEPFAYTEAVVVDGRTDLHLVARRAALDSMEPAGEESARRVVIEGGGFGRDCVSIADSTHITLMDLEILGCERNGIAVSSSRGVVIHRNRIEKVGAAAILVSRSAHTRLLSNTVVDATAEGILLDGAEHSTVVGNDVPPNKPDAIKVVGGNDNFVVGADDPARSIAGAVNIQGPVGIGKEHDHDYSLDVDGHVRTNGQFVSTALPGTSPLVVSSSDEVANLNADLLDGLDSTDLQRHCWDLNENGQCEVATEDRTGDGVCNVTDCQGPPGLDCWDLDGDDTCDPSEAGSDGVCTVADCQGASGGLTGAGTPGFVAKFLTPTTLEDSLIQDSGDTVTIDAPGGLVIRESGGPGGILQMNNPSTNDAVIGAGTSPWPGPTKLVLAGGGLNNGVIELFGAYHETPGMITFKTAPSSQATQERMRIDQYGNVGIGTTSPQTKLDVAGPINASGSITASGLYIQDSGSGEGRVFIGANINEPDEGVVAAGSLSPAPAPSKLHLSGGGLGTGVIELFGAYHETPRMITFGTAPSSQATQERMRIDQYGNVGIGTTGPTAPLHVIVPAEPTSTRAALFETAHTGNGTSIALYATKTHPAQRQWEICANCLTGGDLTFLQSPTFDTDPTEAVMHLATDGNVGIGTTAPASKLHIHEEEDQVVARGSRGSGAIGLVAHENFTHGGLVSSNGLVFRTNWDRSGVSEGATLGLAIDTSGNVGIGTTSPNQRLDINGGLRLRGLLVPPSECTASTAGSLYYESDGGGDQALCVCVLSSGSYQWIKLAGDGTCT